MITLEIRRAPDRCNRDFDVFVGKLSVPQAPAAGELVNFEGEPYFVFERSWAYGTDGGVFCYLRVTPRVHA